MDCKVTENYFKEKVRMSKYDAKTRMCMVNCENCPLSKVNNGKELFCSQLEKIYPEKAIAIVQKWSDEHPLPKPKTYADDFFEKFPNAPKEAGGIPKCCRKHIYGFEDKSCVGIPCYKCWNETMEVPEYCESISITTMNELLNMVAV